MKPESTIVCKFRRIVYRASRPHAEKFHGRALQVAACTAGTVTLDFVRFKAAQRGSRKSKGI